MTNAFETIVIAVTVIGLLLSVTLLQPFRAAREIGRVGESWFEHPDERPLEEGPDASENDPPIPFRPIRAHR